MAWMSRAGPARRAAVEGRLFARQPCGVGKTVRKTPNIFAAPRRGFIAAGPLAALNRHYAAAGRQCTKNTPATQTAMPTSASGLSVFAEQNQRHQRRQRRREIEKTHHARRRRPADHEIVEPYRSERQHDDEIEKRKHEVRRPVHNPGLERERAGDEHHRRGRILDQQCRPPVNAAAEALLIDRADRDAEKRDRNGGPGKRARLSSRGLVAQHQINAGKPKRQPRPLAHADALAEEAMGDGRGQERLQADDQRRKPGRQAVANRHEHAAEIEAVHHEPGGDAVAEAERARPLRPRQRNDDAEEQDDPEHPQRQVGQRLGIGEAELGADEAR